MAHQPQLEEADRSIRAQRAARPKLLFATSAQRLAPQALCRARWLADEMGAQLYVLRVLPRSLVVTGVRAYFQGESGQRLSDFLDAARAALQACTDALGDHFDEEHLELSIGEFVETVASQAEQLDASLVVVPAGERSGSVVTRLVRAMNRPVLVARAPAYGRTVIAAADVGETSFAVLRQAQALAQRLQAAIVPMHNISPRVRTARNHSGTDGVPLAAAGPALSMTEQVECPLADVARELCMPPPVVTRHHDPVEAIMAEAHARRAEVVVVGTRTRSWFARVVRKSVAAQLINRAQRSVLVTPLDPAVCLQWT
jgi:nucleotide-binding universal stress UspA family protein